MIELSIVVPVYNVEKYIVRCIDSILKQTYKDFELVLVDDGSNDKSGEICDSYLRDNRVKVIHQDNKGPFEAIYVGTKYAHGKYVGYVDSDDWIEPQMFEKLVEIKKQYNADAVRCIVNVQQFNGSFDVLENCNDNIVVFGRQDIEYLLERYWEVDGNLYFRWSNTRFDKIWNRNGVIQALESVDRNFSMGEDIILNLRYLNNCKKIVTYYSPLYNLRFNNNSLSHKADEKKYYEFKKEINALAEVCTVQNREGKALKTIKKDLWSWCALMCLAAKTLPYKRVSILKRIKDENVELSFGKSCGLLNLCEKSLNKGRFYKSVFLYDLFRIANKVSGSFNKS